MKIYYFERYSLIDVCHILSAGLNSLDVSASLHLPSS